MGLTLKDVQDLTVGWHMSFSTIYDAMDDAGAFAYASFNFQSTPDKDSIAGVLRGQCAAGASASLYTSALTVLFTTPPACCPANRNTTLLQFNEDLAFFMLVRGPAAWIGYTSTFCAAHYDLPGALFLDYGDPLGTCKETSPGVFQRQFANAVAEFDTNTYQGSVKLT